MASAEEAILVDAPLVPDPDADEELGPGDAQAIADEEIRDCRLLLVRRAAEPVDLDGRQAGAVQFTCTFQPAHGTRFVWARLRLRLATPAGVSIIDLAPRETLDGPVQFTIDKAGKLGLKHAIAEASVESRVQREFAVYHCRVQGSGEGTALARWDFRENPAAHDGLGREQVLALTLGAVGEVGGTVEVSARLSRSGLLGGVDAVRDLIFGPHQRNYPITFTIPTVEPASGLRRFLRLG